MLEFFHPVDSKGGESEAALVRSVAALGRGRMLDAALKFAGENPLLVVLTLYVLMVLFNRNKPFPKVPGSKVRSIGSMNDFQDLVKEAKENGSVLVVDYYATCKVGGESLEWGGPSRRTWGREVQGVVIRETSILTEAFLCALLSLRATGARLAEVRRRYTARCLKSTVKLMLCSLK